MSISEVEDKGLIIPLYLHIEEPFQWRYDGIYPSHVFAQSPPSDSETMYTARRQLTPLYTPEQHHLVLNLQPGGSLTPLYTPEQHHLLLNLPHFSLTPLYTPEQHHLGLNLPHFSGCLLIGHN